MTKRIEEIRMRVDSLITAMRERGHENNNACAEIEYLIAVTEVYREALEYIRQRGYTGAEYVASEALAKAEALE